MRSDEVKRRVDLLTNLRGVYNEGVYDIVWSILRKRRTDRILDFSAIPQSPIFRLADRLGANIAFACPTDKKITLKGTEVFYQAVLIDEAINGRSTQDRISNHCLTSTVEWRDRRTIPTDAKFDVVFGVLEDIEDLKAALAYLDTDGIGIFHVHTHFFRFCDSESKGYSGMQSPRPFGAADAFYIQASLKTESFFLGSCFMEWFADEYLIIVECVKRHDLFVATVTEDPSRNEEILENFRTRRNGSTLRYGFVTSIQYPSFDEYPYYEEAYLMQHPLKASCPASEVVQQILFEDSNELQGSSNSIVVNLPNADAVGGGTVRIVLDPNRALSSYFNLYIDERVKHWARHYIENGRFQNVKYRSWLDECSSQLEIAHRILNTQVHIPDLRTQREIQRLATEIADLSGHVEILGKKMWTEPENSNEVAAELKKLGRSDTLDLWIGLLPFPLASILWAYHAHINAPTKLEHLLNFFEAFVQFNATIMLSALSSRQDFWVSHKHNWIRQDPAYKDAFRMATMGNWIVLGRRMAKFIRQRLKDSNCRKEIQKLFGGFSHESIQAICDSKLWGILSQVLDYRNEWKGHGGISGDVETKRRLEMLESQLSRLRNIISDGYDSMLFVVRKEELRLKEGIHEYRVSNLVGHQTEPLPELTIQIEEPLESDKIYFMSRSKDGSPVRLLPFVQILEDERTSGSVACYYYSCMKNDRCRLVSYHFKSKPEILVDANTLGHALELLISTEESSPSGKVPR
jgi:CRP-like cAMP-binding protein